MPTDVVPDAPSDAIAEIFRPLLTHGAERYGEAITQLAHALQCARLAQLDGGSPALVAAALLHDIGQFIDEAGHAAERDGIDALHEQRGADFLARWYGPEVTEPVRLHVAAKRWMCHADPAYAATLSPASILSLALQGGPMQAEEAAAFAAGPWFADAIALRRCDDAAKRPGWAVPPLERYRPLLQGLLRPAA